MKKVKKVKEKRVQSQTDCSYTIGGHRWRVRVNEEGISLGLLIYDRAVWYDVVIEGLFPALRPQEDDSDYRGLVEAMRRPLVDRVVSLAEQYHHGPFEDFFNASQFRSSIAVRSDEDLAKMELALTKVLVKRSKT